MVYVEEVVGEVEALGSVGRGGLVVGDGGAGGGGSRQFWKRRMR